MCGNPALIVLFRGREGWRAFPSC